MKIIVSLLILFSQFINVLACGSEDEMLCSRAWRLRNDPVWMWVRLALDTVYPLSNWTGIYSSHCEACYQSERKRLEERIRYYLDEEPEELADVHEG